MKKATQERREREREQHRNEILDAAEHVFVKEGAAATVEMIANEAQFAVGSLYNFFSGKDDIFQQVLLRISRQSVDSFQSHYERMIDPPEQGIRVLVGAWFDFHKKHGSFLHMAHVERYLRRKPLGEVSTDEEREHLENRRQCEALLLRYFTLLSQSSAARPLPPEVMMDTFEGFVRMAHFHVMRDQHPRPVSLEPLKAYCTSALNSLFLK